jgi:hypothetical protein
MLHVNEIGSHLRTAGDVAGWLSFAATSMITLIVGFFGRAPAPSTTCGTPGRIFLHSTISLCTISHATRSVLRCRASKGFIEKLKYYEHERKIYYPSKPLVVERTGVRYAIRFDPKRPVAVELQLVGHVAFSQGLRAD